MNEEPVKLDSEKQEALDKTKKEVSDIINKDFIENVLQNNEFTFDINGKTYKVVRPTTAQKQEAYQKKVSQYMKLLQLKDENGNFVYLPEKKLKEMYKERGIDIDDFDRKIEHFTNERNKLQEKIGKMLTENINEKDLDILKKEVVKINDELISLTVSKNSLLEYSLENQSVGYLYEYLTYSMALVKNEKDEFVRCWNSYEDFKKEDSVITNTIGMYVGMMLGSIN